MDGYFSNLDGNFINTSEYVNAMRYTNNYNSESEVLNDNIVDIYRINDDNTTTYRRMCKVYVNGTYGYITTLYKVGKTSPTNYHGVTIGMTTTRDLHDAVKDVITVLGVESKTDEGINYIVDGIKNANSGLLSCYDSANDNVEIVINDAKQSLYDNAFIELVRNLFFEKTANENTPQECVYNYEQKLYDEGQGYLVEWDNDTLPDAVGGLMYDDDTLIHGSDIDYENIRNNLIELSKTDARLKEIMTCPIVRIGFKVPPSPNYFQLNICGYTILNGSVVTTTESGTNQHYSVQLSSVNWINYQAYTGSADYPVWHKMYEGQSSASGTEIFYNYVSDRWLSDGGMMTGGSVIHYRKVIDSIGFVGSVKPYEVLPNATAPNRNQTIPQNYPNWTIDNIIISRPVSINQTIQTFTGIPDITITYDNRPIVNLYKINVIEENASDTKVQKPTNSDYGLFTIYLPDNDDMTEINGNLWKPSIITQLKEIFNNSPLDAVISLHEVYLIGALIDGGTVSGHTYEGIKEQTKKICYFGNVPMTSSGIDWTKQRYIQATLGSLNIERDFQDCRDFQTKYSIYLPFIGFKDIDPWDIVGANTKKCAIEVIYTFDMLTGDCIANMYVSRDGLTDYKFMYTWNGSISTDLPLSGANFTNRVKGIADAIGGVVGGIMGGNAVSVASGLASGVGNMLSNMGTPIEKGGNVSGNFGAMNYKQAYLLINKPRILDTVYNDIQGFTTNIKATLSTLTGFVRVKDCHVDTIPNASDSEKNEILSLLKSGVIL